MKWKTSKGEVAPIFVEKSNGCSYTIQYGYVGEEIGVANMVGQDLFSLKEITPKINTMQIHIDS